MARNSTEQLVAICSRETSLFPVHGQHGQDMNFTSIYKCDIMLFLWFGVSPVLFLLPNCLFPRERLCFRAFGHLIFETKCVS